MQYEWQVKCQSGRSTEGSSLSYEEALEDMSLVEEIYETMGQTPCAVAVYFNKKLVMALHKTMGSSQ